MKKLFSLLIISILMNFSSILSAQSKNDIYEVQRMLNSLGFNAGVADGLYGTKTDTALTLFFESIRQEYDGTLDQEELIAITKVFNDGNASVGINADCNGKVDKKVPQVTKLDCSLKRVSKYIKHPSGTIKSHHIPSEEAAMTVRGFPSHPKSNVFRFQTMIGVCAKNDFDCRPENVNNRTIRSEVSLPEEDDDRASAGDRTVVEYDLYIARNPDFKNLAANGDWFNFGQFHGHGDEDVPFTVAIARNDNRVKLVKNGKRTNASPTPGSLAVYMRSIVFDEVLQEANQNSAVVLADPGSFEDRWMKIRIEVKWESTKTGNVDIHFDDQRVFECSKCVTLPIYKEAAVRDGIKGEQKFHFQFGVYSWRLGNSNEKKDPPIVVAYYKNVNWEKR